MSNCSIIRCISTASLPWTGTGKNRSISVAAFAVLAVLLLAYQTAVAMIFVGVTRYRVPWDFVLCVLAAATVLEVVRRVREWRFAGGARKAADEPA